MKRKLLLAALAVIGAFWGGSTLCAQTDVTSKITNPTITGNADGWTISGQARYFNGTGFDGTASFFELTNWGSSWDATISQEVTGLENGYYKLRAAGQMSNTADCWMKLVGNGAESYFSRNGDTGGNILADGTETTIGGGVAGWRYTSVIAKVTDGTLTISVVGHSDEKERWANVDHFTLTYLGAEIPANTDVTDYISNWDFWGCFNDNFNGWTIATSGGNTWVHGNTAVEFWNNNLNATFDYYQEISNLPEGRYEISASMWSTQGTPNGNSGVYGTSNGVTVFAGVTDDCDDANLHTYTTDGIFVTDGSLRLGVKNNGARSSNWFGVDWIKLNYMGKVVQDYAVALPEGGAMEADKWYYFDIAAAADNYVATAADLSSIVCTTDGNTLTSAATGNVTLAAENNDFAATRYYVKSSAANSLAISVASYSYSISEPTISTTYVQAGNTVTVNYTASTNEPGLSLTQDYSGVTFGGDAITVTPTASGFTFTVPTTVTANTDYVLAIPAGAIKYNDDNQNAAQNFTLKTPALLDGTYFFKVANETAAKGKYLARGYNYGTHATIDKYGLPIIVATDSEGKTTLSPADTKRYYFHTNTYDCFADQASVNDNAKFIISIVDGKYRIHNTQMEEGRYFKYNTSAENDAVLAVYDDGNGTNSGPIIEWTIESAADHAAAMQALKDAQAAATAAAAYASGDYASLNGITTVAALEAELTANYIQGDFVAPSEIASVSEIYEDGGNGSQPANNNTIGKNVYSNTINITKAGFYKFSMQAFYRAGSNEVVQAMHTAGVDFPPVVLFFDNQETQIKSVYDESSSTALVEGWGNVTYDGANYPNNTDASLKMFQAGKYHNDVWFYASEPGIYTYGVRYQGFANKTAQWFIYSPESVTITSYAAEADADDYAALNAAINAYDDAVWGFEEGEYAPYANKTAIENIAAARAISSSESNSKLLVNSLTEALALTANTEEVNAIYNPTFSLSTNDMTALGWVGSGDAVIGNESGQYHSRAFVGNSNLTAFGNASNSALYLRFDGTGGSAINTVYTYGNTDAYTLPLKASVYRMTGQLGVWSNDVNQRNRDIKVYITNEAGQEIASQTVTEPNNTLSADGGTVVDFNFVATLPAAGNYKFNVANVSGGSTAIVISNLELAKEPETNATMTVRAGKWGTFIAPFDVTIPDNVTAYIVTGVNENDRIVTESVKGTIPANTPVVLKNETEEPVSETFTGQSIATKDSYEEGLLTGVYTQTDVPVSGDEATTYVLQTQNDVQAFYKVDNESVYCIANRAYLTVRASTSAKSRVLYFDFDGEATGIDGVDAEGAKAAGTKGVYYNLNGQRVENPTQGIYILNGKKVLVK